MKSIKSIKIVDGKSSAVKQYFDKQNEQKEIFSFSKRDRSRSRKTIHHSDLQNQRKQINDLERMVKGMLRKCQIQNKQFQTITAEYEQWQHESRKNEQNKKKLLELKQLMKSILLQRQESRCLEFYEQNE